MIGIVDYGAGNLFSVEQAVRKLGYSVTIISKPTQCQSVDKIIFPGVGNAKRTMDILHEQELSGAICHAIDRGIPFLGICLGMQLLLEYSEENETAGLAVLAGRVKPFQQPLKVPHMGWNEVIQTGKHQIFKHIPNLADFYFVHSYYAQPAYPEDSIGRTTYGEEFTSVIAKKNVIGVQFHPERSGDHGLQLLDNFCSIV